MIEILAVSSSDEGKIIGVLIAKVAIISYFVYKWLSAKDSNKSCVPPTAKSHKKGIQQLANEINSKTPVDSRYKYNPPKKEEAIKSDSIKSDTDTKIGLAGEIESFANLRDKGVITEEEFQEQKKRLLNSNQLN